MINVDSILGVFEWSEFVMSNGYVVLLPDVGFLVRLIVLLIAIIYTIKGVFSLIHTMSRR